VRLGASYQPGPAKLEENTKSMDRAVPPVGHLQGEHDNSDEEERDNTPNLDRATLVVIH
jgi:hypothetical protein